MKNVPFPPPATFEVRIMEADPWSPRPMGTPLPVRLLTSLQVPWARGVDERLEAAREAASNYFDGKRKVSVISADDFIKATVTKEKPQK